MLLDKATLFSDAQDFNGQGAGSVNSTNVYDMWGQAAQSAGPLGTPVFDIGRGEDVDILIQVVLDILSGGAATFQVQVIAADTADLATNPVILYDSGAIAKATLVAGYQFRIDCLPPGLNGKRYLGIKYTVAVAALTQGKVTAALCFDKQTSPGSFV